MLKISHLILRNKYKMMGKRAAKAPTLIELVKRISLKETNLKPEVIEEEIEEGLGGSSKGPMFLWLPKGKRLNYILIIFASAQEIAASSGFVLWLACIKRGKFPKIALSSPKNHHSSRNYGGDDARGQSLIHL